MKYLIVVITLVSAGLMIPAWGMTIREDYRQRTELTAARTQAAIIKPVPVLVGEKPADLFSSQQTTYAVDAATMTPLYAQNSEIARPVASIAKLVTIMVILANHDLDERVTIGQLPQYDSSSERLGLVPGQVFTVEDLVKASLISSSNDAADALAIYDAGSQKAFTAKMNRYLSVWGISQTKFSSATGLEETSDTINAASLAKIAKIALTNSTIKTLAATQTATIKDGSGQAYNLKTTDQLLSEGRFYGIKTGYTFAAGQCFMGLTKVDGHEVITVVLGSSDRFGDTKRLINYIEGAWQWQ